MGVIVPFIGIKLLDVVLVLPAPGVTMIREHLRPAVVLTLLLCVITGLLYPGVVTVFAQLLFPRQATARSSVRDGQPVGSRLIGQAFVAPYYFHPRPSAAGAGYDATASAGTNKGPTDRKLADTLIAQAVEKVVRRTVRRRDTSRRTW